jgi:2-amino-4-hydroxy-6-hydroxymethyldihydropteridine diphosphokinase
VVGVVAYVALGSNLGDRETHLRRAMSELAEHGDIRVTRVSSLHETDPVGGPVAQGRYLNAVAELRTSLTPRALLARLLEIEQQHGRVRTERDGPRTLDLDLLLYGDEHIDEPGLTVPHPRMWEREFVMRPLAQLCDPNWLASARARTRRTSNSP